MNTVLDDWVMLAIAAAFGLVALIAGCFLANIKDVIDDNGKTKTGRRSRHRGWPG